MFRRLRRRLAGDIFGLATSDSFFIDRLTNEYMTDVTTASRTSLMDLHARVWDRELCPDFRSSARPPSSDRRVNRPAGGAISRSGKCIPLVATLVDQQAALFESWLVGCAETQK